MGLSGSHRPGCHGRGAGGLSARGGGVGPAVGTDSGGPASGGLVGGTDEVGDDGRGQFCDEGDDGCVAAWPLVLVEGRADGGHERHRVDRGGRVVAAEVHLEMQVRTRRVAGGAGDADDVTGAHVLAFGDGGMDELVAVAGDDAAGVFDVDVPAAAGDVG
jgi:hypothetical protein